MREASVTTTPPPLSPRVHGIKGLRDVIDCKRSARQSPEHIDVSLDRSDASEQSPDAAQAAFIAHGSREFCRSAGPHRRQNDRHLNAEKVTEWCFQHGVVPQGNCKIPALAFKRIQHLNTSSILRPAIILNVAKSRRTKTYPARPEIASSDPPQFAQESYRENQIKQCVFKQPRSFATKPSRASVGQCPLLPQ